MTHDENILAAIEPLRDAGFALHWLKPRKKAPIGENWQIAPVPSTAELRATHRKGYNVGVRPGEPSNLGGLYLHLIDMDIRVAEMADECWSKLRDLLPCDPDTLPMVISGSGGESRHLYFLTDKPFQSRKLAMSEGKVRRWDAARKKDVWSSEWEIELFGTGKQVVLPPSIHPDTGKPYVWAREFDFFEVSLGLGPVIASDAITAMGAVDTTTYAYEEVEPLDFKPGQMEAELALIPVSGLHYDDWLRLGQALHHQLGGTEEGFALWLEHSRRSEKHDAGYERTMRRKYRSFGRYRGRPVTMATIRTWAIEERSKALIAELDDFDDLDPLEAELDDFEAALDDSDDDEDLLADFDPNCEAETKSDKAKLEWMSLLDPLEDGKGWRPTLHNVELIVKNDPRLIGVPQLNEFTQETVQRFTPGTKKGRRNAAKETRQLTGRVWEVRDTLNGELWSDDRDFAIRSILEAPRTQGGYAMKVTDRDLRAAIVLAANSNAFHPIREYLSGLEWDGVERVDRLWIDYVNAVDDAYHRDVACLVMVAAVARVFEPGHKFDYATILEGLQGKRKSTLIEVLGRKWFAELDGDFHDQKQMIELMQGAWIMEIPELTGFSRADVRSIKAFISRKKDRARLAYARRAGEFPRQCVFIGSTNDREYLKDDTGGRRFWPVKCRLSGEQEIDTDRLEANVDQLWAEAVVIYQQMRKDKPRGTLPLYLSNPESRLIAARLQESRRLESPDDVLAGQIAEWLSKPIVSGSIDDDRDADGKPRYRTAVCTAMVWVECLGKEIANFKTVEQSQVNRAMAKLSDWLPDGQQRFERYGKQRVFRHVSTMPPDEQ